MCSAAQTGAEAGCDVRGRVLRHRVLASTCVVNFGQVRGKKVLVLDPRLGGPLTMLVQTSVLKARRAAPRKRSPRQEPVPDAAALGDAPPSESFPLTSGSDGPCASVRRIRRSMASSACTTSSASPSRRTAARLCSSSGRLWRTCKWWRSRSARCRGAGAAPRPSGATSRRCSCRGGR